MERVKVINPYGFDSLGTECYIGGNKIEVKSVDFHVGIDKAPVFTFETVGIPDIDMSGDVQFKFTPHTVHEAAAIIVKTFSDKRAPEYKVLVDSIYSALEELQEESDIYDVATAIVDRIIGLEEI